MTLTHNPVTTRTFVSAAGQLLLRCIKNGFLPLNIQVKSISSRIFQIHSAVGQESFCIKIGVLAS